MTFCRFQTAAVNCAYKLQVFTFSWTLIIQQI